VPSTSDLQTAKNSDQARPQPEEIRAEASDSDDENGAASEPLADKVEKADKNGAKTGAPTIAFGNQEAVVVPNLAGQTVRSVMEACSRIGLVPALIGSGVALEQSVEAGTQVARGTRLTVRFGRAGQLVPASVKGAGN
jgi:hypothetical protein